MPRVRVYLCPECLMEKELKIWSEHKIVPNCEMGHKLYGWKKILNRIEEKWRMNESDNWTTGIT